MDLLYVIILIALFLVILWKIVARRVHHGKGKIILLRTTSNKSQSRSRGIAYYTISFADKEKLYHSAFQMDIFLPQGCFFVAFDGREEYALMNKKSGVYPRVGTTFDHTIGSALRSDNHLFVMLFDGSGKKPFVRHNGRLFDICIRVPENFDISDLQIKAENVQFRSSNGTKYLYDNQILKVVKPLMSGNRTRN